jgi:hypothetical protein
MRTLRLLGVAPTLVLALTTAACVTAETAPSATVTTIDPANARWFQLDWVATQAAGSNAQSVDGYVNNNNGEAARVQLLAQALDASGQVVDQKSTIRRLRSRALAAPTFISGRSPLRITIR